MRGRAQYARRDWEPVRALPVRGEERRHVKLTRGLGVRNSDRKGVRLVSQQIG